MLLTIGKWEKTKVYPDWWQGPEPGHVEEFKSLKLWWDGLQWQEYTPTMEKIYFNGCGEDVWCHMDNGAYTLLTHWGDASWLYKMFANAGYQVKMGIIQEWENIMNLF